MGRFLKKCAEFENTMRASETTVEERMESMGFKYFTLEGLMVWDLDSSPTRLSFSEIKEILMYGFGCIFWSTKINDLILLGDSEHRVRKIKAMDKSLSVYLLSELSLLMSHKIDGHELKYVNEVKNMFNATITHIK